MRWYSIFGTVMAILMPTGAEQEQRLRIEYLPRTDRTVAPLVLYYGILRCPSDSECYAVGGTVIDETVANLRKLTSEPGDPIFRIEDGRGLDRRLAAKSAEAFLDALERRLPSGDARMAVSRRRVLAGQ